MTTVSRNPIALFAVTIMAVFQALLQAALFFKVASQSYSFQLSDNVRITSNFLGLAFLVCSDQFITMSFGQVMNIPLALPMLNREVQNHMYRSMSFYWSAIFASTLSFLFYPVIVSIVSFWFYGLDDSGFVAFLNWTAALTLTATCGFTFGMMLGAIVGEQNAAIQTNLLFGMVFSFGGGMYANTGTGANPLIRALSFISPIRPASELLLRAILKEKQGGSIVLNYFGFTWGDRTCFLALAGFTVVSLVAGWIVIAFKYRNV